MNNLELKSIGVQELDTNEMTQVDGGIAPLVAIFLIDLAMGAFAVGAYNGYHAASK